MKVGVLCECSGVVRDAFLRRGHEAVSCDLKPTRSPGPHIQADCRSVDWSPFDLLVMHPDCTYLASSGLHWNGRIPGRAEKTEEALEFVRWLMSFRCRWALENPIGCIGTRVRPADQIIQPWMFGEDASKATCLWLNGLPLLTPTRIVPPKYACKCGAPRFEERLGEYGCAYCGGSRGPAKLVHGNQTPSGQNRLGPSEMRKELRSNTYAGIAEAMASQWG